MKRSRPRRGTARVIVMIGLLEGCGASRDGSVESTGRPDSSSRQKPVIVVDKETRWEAACDPEKEMWPSHWECTTPSCPRPGSRGCGEVDEDARGRLLPPAFASSWSQLGSPPRRGVLTRAPGPTLPLPDQNPLESHNGACSRRPKNGISRCSKFSCTAGVPVSDVT
jgi:hypothetical protein